MREIITPSGIIGKISRFAKASFTKSPLKLTWGVGFVFSGQLQSTEPVSSLIVLELFQFSSYRESIVLAPAALQTISSPLDRTHYELVHSTDNPVLWSHHGSWSVHGLSVCRGRIYFS